MWYLSGGSKFLITDQTKTSNKPFILRKKQWETHHRTSVCCILSIDVTSCFKNFLCLYWMRKRSVPQGFYVSRGVIGWGLEERRASMLMNPSTYPVWPATHSLILSGRGEMVAHSFGKSWKKGCCCCSKIFCLTLPKMDAVNYCQQERLISQSIATFSQLWLHRVAKIALLQKVALPLVVAFTAGPNCTMGTIWLAHRYYS